MLTSVIVLGLHKRCHISQSKNLFIRIKATVNNNSFCNELQFLCLDADPHYQNGASVSNDKSKIWLECYQYLKIYSIWGNETLGELKSDQDTYDHVTSLWNQLTVSNLHKNASNGQVNYF